MFLHTIFSEVAAMFSSHHVVYFTYMYIDNFSIELYTFQQMSRFIPYHSYSKIGKIWILLENLAHIKRQSVFSIQLLCNYI